MSASLLSRVTFGPRPRCRLRPRIYSSTYPRFPQTAQLHTVISLLSPSLQLSPSGHTLCRPRGSVQLSCEFARTVPRLPERRHSLSSPVASSVPKSFHTSTEPTPPAPSTPSSAQEWSWIEGPTEPPLLDVTIGEYLSRIVALHGDRPAVTSHHQNVTLTFTQLFKLSSALASRLHNTLSVQPGDRVCVQLGNTVEHVVIAFALFKLGAVLIPLNPSFNSDQVVRALAHLGAQHLVVSRVARKAYGKEKSNAPIVKTVLSKREDGTLPGLRNVAVVNNDDQRSYSFGKITRIPNEDFDAPDILQTTILFEDLAGDEGGPIQPFPQPRDPSATINIQFTSGTTSTPKAACLSHRNILNNGKSIGDRLCLGSSDSMCCPPPLFHCFGSVLGLMATVTHGSAIVFPAEAFDPRASIEAAEIYDCTGLYGVPTMFAAELELMDGIGDEDVRSKFPRLRTGIAAGSTVPAELMARLSSRLGLTELCNCYGMTETSPVSCMTRRDDPVQKRLETVGKPLPHVNVKIVDPLNRERVLPTGQRGELAVSGYLLMSKYWDDERQTAEVLVEQEGDDPNLQSALPPSSTNKKWMYTGDEAVIDSDGYVRITGRIKDLIIRGGENIHPLEIENCLFAHPAVCDSGVVGVPSEKYGEEVAAFVVLHQKQRYSYSQLEQLGIELREWVRIRLCNHLVPKFIFWIHELPKTASGKVQKFRLREMATEKIQEELLTIPAGKMELSGSQTKQDGLNKAKAEVN